jgi:uncharacterized membrane protein (GlpM family)
MRMFRSFLLRLTLILSTTATISLLLMAATLGIQGLRDGMVFCIMLFVLLLIWLVANYFVVRKTDPEVSVEVARLLFPSGAILSIFLSLLLSLMLDGMIPGTEGMQHYIVVFVGLGIAFFLIVRCFDIKWLRGEAEILSLEERSK